VEQTLSIPDDLLQDDNHPQDIALPVEIPALPISSAPQYTIYRLVKHLGVKSILEIGTQSGASPVAMALALRDNHLPIDITCVDPFLPTGDNDGLSTLTDWYKNVYGSGFKAGVQLLVTTSAQVLPILGRSFDFVFVDGSHLYRDVKEDCLLSLLLLEVGGWFLVHDYVVYESVRRACDEIVAEFCLPHSVNSIQRNYRGELCGWMIARKNRALSIEEIHRQLGMNLRKRDWETRLAPAKRRIPPAAKRTLRRFLKLFR